MLGHILLSILYHKSIMPTHPCLHSFTNDKETAAHQPPLLCYVDPTADKRGIKYLLPRPSTSRCFFYYDSIRC